jgi:hypothetical protein
MTAAVSGSSNDSCHHMAPVAGGITNTEKDRFVFPAGFSSASSPMDTKLRVLSVLEQ